MANDIFTQETVDKLNASALTFNEVVTSHAGGVSTGAIIDQTLTPLGETTDTLKGRLDKIGVHISDWASTNGGTLTSPAQAFLNNTSGSVGFGNYYSWSGAFPKTVAPGTDPAAVGSGYTPRTDVVLRNELTSSGATISDIASLPVDISGAAGAEKVGFKSRTQYKKNKDIRDIRDFGADTAASPEVNGDALDAMLTEMISDGDLCGYIRERYTVDRKAQLNQQGMTLLGGSSWGSGLNLDTGSTDDSVIDVTARLCRVDDMMLTSSGKIGLLLGSSAASAQLFKSKGLITKGNSIGTKHVNANSAVILDLFAESDAVGYASEAVNDGNVNGCTIQARAYNCTTGFEVRNNITSAANNAFMHNFLRWTAEGNTYGIRDLTTGDGVCRYNYGFLYAEGNSSANFDLNEGQPNWWAISNPNNDVIDLTGKQTGVDTRGANISQIIGRGVQGIASKVFTGSSSITGFASTYVLTNTSGATAAATLSFASYMPVGSTVTLWKADNTAGLTLTAPAGITFIGDTGAFGAFVATGVAELIVHKISSTQCILKNIPKTS